MSIFLENSFVKRFILIGKIQSFFVTYQVDFETLITEEIVSV